MPLILEVSCAPLVSGVGMLGEDCMQIYEEQRAALKGLIVFLLWLFFAICGWFVAFAYWIRSFE